MAEIEIMFSYLLLVGFITFIFTISGQSIFGVDFPANPFTTTTFKYEPNCDVGDWGCNAIYNFSQSMSMLSIPFIFLGYLWSMFLFFMLSPTLWWLGTLLFIPAGIIFLIIIYPILIKVVEIIVRILHAIAEALPF